MNNRPGRCIAVSALMGKNHVEELDIVKSQIAFRRPAVDLRENRCKDVSKSAKSLASYWNKSIISEGLHYLRLLLREPHQQDVYDNQSEYRPEARALRHSDIKVVFLFVENDRAVS